MVAGPGLVSHSFKLAMETVQLLDRHAKARGWTKTKVLVEALEAWDAANPVDGSIAMLLTQARVAQRRASSLLDTVLRLTKT